MFRCFPLPSLLLFILLLSSSSFSKLQRFHHPVKSDGSLSLLVVGDWGRKGRYNQSQVAEQMGKIGEKLAVDFVISTGDNFYPKGLTGVDDRAFEQSFTDVYTAESLQKQWYAVLGNHDYRGNALAQLSPVLQKRDARWFCLRSYVLEAEIADFFFVDTTPFVNKYWIDTKYFHDWREVAPKEEYIENLLKELDDALKDSMALWKFVVGHHTMRSVCRHGDTKELQEKLLSVFKENMVDAYINGHDHCLEHISSRDSPMQFLTSGGGSKAWKGIFRSTEEELEFFYDGQGFMSLYLMDAKANFAFYDVFGRILYEFSLAKPKDQSIHSLRELI